MTEEQKEVFIYSTPTCMYCNMLKAYLDEKGVKYTNYDVSQPDNQDKAKEMVEATGQMGVPVSKIGDQYIVGFNQPLIAELLGLE